MPIDLPPLLGPGLHSLTLTELQRLAVEDRRFRLSSTRPRIMRGVWDLCACLSRWGVGEEVWIDGSFLTEKINPKDADLVLVLAENFENAATDEQLAIWDWWDELEPKTLFHCDTFTVPKIGIGEPDYPFFLQQ